MASAITTQDKPFGPDCKCAFVSGETNFLCIQLQDEENTMFLRSVVKSNIPLHNIVVRPSVMNIFSKDVKITAVIEDQICTGFEGSLHLEFVKYKKFENWDEIAITSGFHIPQAFLSSWPENLDLNFMESILPRLFGKVYVSMNSLICVEFQDVLMVFRVIILSKEKVSMLPSLNIYDIDLSIESTIKVIIPRNVRSSSTHPHNLDLQLSPLECVRVSYVAICASLHRTRNIPAQCYHSFLLCATEGAGKSSLLRLIQQHAKEKLDYQPIHISIKSLQSITPSLETRIMEAIKEHLQNMQNMEYAVKLLQLLGCVSTENTLEHFEYSSHRPVILLLDDVDDVLTAVVRTYEVTAMEKYTSPLLQGDAPVVLSALLQTILTIATTNVLPLIVIGSTSMSKSEVPSSGAGVPLFEKLLSLDRPTLQDRRVLLQGVLRLFTDLEPLPRNLHPEDAEDVQENRDAWALQLAKLCPGYLPGDIAKIGTRLQSLYVGQLQNSPLNASDPAPASQRVQWKQALSAVALVQPKQIDKIQSFLQSSEGASEERLSWDDFAGYPMIKTRLMQKLKQIGTSNDNKVKTLSSSLNRQNGGIVLYGGSGCGKSYLAKIISSEASTRFLSVRCTELLSKYFGETEANIRSIFAHAVPPCMLFFDEFDVFAHKRSENDESNGLHGRILSTFLNELDGTTMRGTDDDGGITVIVACKSLRDLDDALLRPGRLSCHIEIPSPSREDIVAILEYKMRGISLEEHFNMDDIVNQLLHNRPSCSDLDLICKEAIMNTVRSIVSEEERSNNQDLLSTTAYTVRKSDFQNAMVSRYGDLTLFSTPFTFHMGTTY